MKLHPFWNVFMDMKNPSEKHADPGCSQQGVSKVHAFSTFTRRNLGKSSSCIHIIYKYIVIYIVYRYDTNLIYVCMHTYTYCIYIYLSEKQ